MTTTNPLAASVHISRLDAINRENMTEYLDSFKGHFTKIVSSYDSALCLPFADSAMEIGLRPTGWTYRSDSGANKVPAVAQVIANQTHKNYSPAWLYPQRDSTDRVQGYGVPYSEHSVRLVFTSRRKQALINSLCASSLSASSHASARASTTCGSFRRSMSTLKPVEARCVGGSSGGRPSARGVETSVNL